MPRALWGVVLASEGAVDDVAADACFTGDEGFRDACCGLALHVHHLLGGEGAWTVRDLALGFGGGDPFKAALGDEGAFKLADCSHDGQHEFVGW